MNISNLFENLMTYNDVNKKKVNESDSTLLNLTVELPTDSEEITPEDVKVDVGVMTVDTSEAEDVDNSEITDNETDETPSDDNSEDVTPDDEDKSSEETSSDDNDEKPNKEESLKLRKEAIRKKRLEAKQVKEAKKECTGKEDCTCESCKSEKESNDVETEGLFNRKKNKKQDDNTTKSSKDTYMVVQNFGMELPVETGFKSEKDAVEYVKNHGGTSKLRVRKESADVETAKSNIRKRVANVSECNTSEIKKEALMHLDTKSLNKLMTEFVKENYKNIDKVVITKAMLENKMLKLEGVIRNSTGETKNISITNRGFDAFKLEGKRFVMDFKDTSNTFNVIKESLKQPFTFTCTLNNGVLMFESLNYSFKTKIDESKQARISGSCVLNEQMSIKQDTKQIEKSSLTENADQIKKFNEIIEKIKAAKTPNELSACKDELDDSNIGDTLLSAAQMVWDDVNSRMKAN